MLKFVGLLAGIDAESAFANAKTLCDSALPLIPRSLFKMRLENFARLSSVA